MHIRAFVGAAVLAMLSFGLSPAIMAAPPPELCVVDLAEPAVPDFLTVDVLDLAVAGADVTCNPTPADMSVIAASLGGAQDDAARSCFARGHTPLDFAAYRLHVDPGRCPS